MQQIKDAQAAGQTRQTLTYTHSQTVGGNKYVAERVLMDTHDTKPCLPVATYRRGAHIEHCLCTPQNAVPRGLPWEPQPPFDQNAVNGVSVVLRKHTPASMQVMAPYFAQQCAVYNISTFDAASTLAALHTYLDDPSVARRIDSNMRHKALCVALEMHGKCATKPAERFVDEGRTLEWTRLIEFAGEASLSLLVTGGITGTAGCATYLAAQYAAGQMALHKSTFCLVTKLSTPIIAVGAGAGAVALGAVTTACAVGSVGYYVAVINAFRDVWDQEPARDAFLLHRLHDHKSATKDNVDTCRHYGTSRWTSPGGSMSHAWRGGRSN